MENSENSSSLFLESEKVLMIIRVIFLYICIILAIDTQIVTATDSITSALPKAEQGTLDLQQIGWELGEDGPIPLNGEWEFFWLQLLTANEETSIEEIASENGMHGFIQVPAIWSSQSINGFQLSDQGFGTYRLHIKLSPNDVGQTQAFMMPSVATAYDLWINGERIEGNGIVGKSLDKMKAQNFPKVVHFTPITEELEIIIQVSNFVQRKGGLWSEIRFGKAEDITSQREKNIMTQIAVVGGLFVMGLYHIALYFFRKNERSTLFFGIACLLIGVRTLLVGEVLWFQFWPEFSWEVGVKLEYLSAFIGIGFFVIYAYYLHPQDASRKITHGLFAFICFVCVPILFFPAQIYTNWMLFYSIILLLSLIYLMYVVLLATIRKRKGAWINFLAMLIFLLTVVNDVFYYNHIIRTGDLVGVGMFTFIFAQALVLASRFSQSFLQVEKLSNQLQEANQNLELKVKQRTFELERSNTKLKQEEASRKSLLSNISHELGTPLTSLIGYILAMKKGFVRFDDPKYIHVLYEKALIVQRLMDDLKSLVRLESIHMGYTFKKVNVSKFYQSLDGQYQLDAEKKGIKLTKDDMYPVPPENLYLNADTERLGQVVMNFIANAITHTEPGGKVIVSGKYFPAFQKVAILVKDTGVGIKSSETSKVFDRFYKANINESNESNGSGLGLAISKEIIHKHNGRIGVRSKEEEGSTFYFILPVYQIDLSQGRD